MAGRSALLASVLALASATAGCGLGAGEERQGGAELRVTRDFGKRLLKAERVAKVRDDLTVMRLLRANNEVKTRYGGRFVQAIGGVVSVRVRGYDDGARGVPVAGARVSAGGAAAVTDGSGNTHLRLARGRYTVRAAKPGLVRSFGERLVVP